MKRAVLLHGIILFLSNYCEYNGILSFYHDWS